MAHFEEEALELGDDGGFDLSLGGGGILGEIEEFEDVGVLDEVANAWLGRGRGRSLCQIRW